MKPIGVQIREAREARDYQQVELGQELGYGAGAQAMVTRWETGNRKVPLDVLPRIAALLGVRLTQRIASDGGELIIIARPAR